VKDLYSKLKWKEPIDTLREYCQSNPLAETEVILDDYFLKERELYQAVDAIARIVLRMGPKKVGTVIMYGMPNTGKSRLLKMIEKIFVCDKLVQTTRDFDFIPALKSHQFQVVVVEEANMSKMFKESRLD
jgi:ribosome biogenesis GTPase A